MIGKETIVVTIKRPDSEDIKEVICPHCNEIILYEESDVDILNNDSYGIYCPNCSAEVEIEKRDNISAILTASKKYILKIKKFS